MRGAIVIVLVIFSVAIANFVGGAAVEPMGEEVKEYDSIENINGAETIETTYDVVFKWAPLTLMGGMGVWAIAWYFRREAFRGRV